MDAAQQTNRIQEMIYGLMMGTLLLFFVWAVLQWSLRREALMAAFAFTQLMSATHAVVYVGYARMLGADYFSAAARGSATRSSSPANSCGSFWPEGGAL